MAPLNAVANDSAIAFAGHFACLEPGIETVGALLYLHSPEIQKVLAGRSSELSSAERQHLKWSVEQCKDMRYYVQASPRASSAIASCFKLVKGSVSTG
ncbi:hypothetical protein PC116_g5583 [Phytophthora cactorum]|nr:hypothetical protein PC116_g5583 [Phytophthora cactorum]